jgi:hypothetical protein
VLKNALGARVTVVGCSPAASDVMRASVAAGRVVDAPWQETLSDATAGGVEEGAVTLAPCIAGVDEWCGPRGAARGPWLALRVRRGCHSCANPPSPCCHAAPSFRAAPAGSM